jgi:hypothetical protein
MLYPNDWPFWVSFLIGVVLFVIALIVMGLVVWAVVHGVALAFG